MLLLLIVPHISPRIVFGDTNSFQFIVANILEWSNDLVRELTENEKVIHNDGNILIVISPCSHP